MFPIILVIICTIMLKFSCELEVQIAEDLGIIRDDLHNLRVKLRREKNVRLSMEARLKALEQPLENEHSRGSEEVEGNRDNAITKLDQGLKQEKLKRNKIESTLASLDREVIYIKEILSAQESTQSTKLGFAMLNMTVFREKVIRKEMTKDLKSFMARITEEIASLRTDRPNLNVSSSLLDSLTIRELDNRLQSAMKRILNLTVEMKSFQDVCNMEMDLWTKWKTEFMHRVVASENALEQLKSELPIFCDQSIDYHYEKSINVCYKVHSQRLNHSSSMTECQSEGGHLLRINTPEKLAYFTTTLRTGTHVIEWFIDGTDEEEEGVWKYGNGEMITEFHWRSGQPDDSINGNCLGLICQSKTGCLWHDFYCMWRHMFVCEI